MGDDSFKLRRSQWLTKLKEMSSQDQCTFIFNFLKRLQEARILIWEVLHFNEQSLKFESSQWNFFLTRTNILMVSSFYSAMSACANILG